MHANTFGHIFRLSSFGESHGAGVGGVIDGCPANVTLDLEAIQAELNRRKPGQSAIVTQRKEADEVSFFSGIFEGKSTGTPIGFVIHNTNQKSNDYDHIKKMWRPSHADYTYDQKYGHRDHRGGGRSSARETAARVVAGAIAKQVLAHYDVNITGYVSGVGEIKLPAGHEQSDLSATESNIVRCPDEAIATRMIDRIKEVRKAGDTIGGVVSCVIKNTPVGIGAPVFAKLHADLGSAMMGINAVKGFEYGSGFAGTESLGSEHNDQFLKSAEGVTTKTNKSGGIQGGISNGEDIYFNVAFKPVATIMQPQDSLDSDLNDVIVEGKGRHDPCVVPRAVVIVESMAAMVILDHILLNRTTQL